eukprot:10297678-Lingulodinium_polyedra.AAC.1
MMRLKRRFAATTDRAPHTRALHARARHFSGARAWSTRACDLRAAAAADGRYDRTVVQHLQNAAQ